MEINGAPKLLNAEIPRDSDLQELLEVYRPGLEKWETQIVGSTQVFLDGNCRLEECNLGNFIADSWVDYNASNFKDDVAIGFIHSGGVRVSIGDKQGGNISFADASMVLPFGNGIVVIEVTGKDLLAALENSVHR